MRLARLDFFGQRIAVAGRSTLQNIRDVHLFARKSDACEQLFEQLACRTDERHSLLVLVEAGRLADEHQVGIRIAGTEDHLSAAFSDRALGPARTHLAES